LGGKFVKNILHQSTGLDTLARRAKWTPGLTGKISPLVRDTTMYWVVDLTFRRVTEHELRPQIEEDHAEALDW